MVFDLKKVSAQGRRIEMKLHEPLRMILNEVNLLLIV